MKLGYIGDDFTGSSYMANTLAKSGMATAQYVAMLCVQANPSLGTGAIRLDPGSGAGSAIDGNARVVSCFPILKSGWRWCADFARR